MFKKSIACFGLFAISFSAVLSAQTTDEKSKPVSDDKKTEQKTDQKSDAKEAKTETKKKPPAPIKFKVLDDELAFAAPGTWVKKKPRNNIVEVEFSIPKVGKDAADGRLTFMGSRGTFDANIERWYGQWKQPDGAATKDFAKITKATIAGKKVNLVEITGNFLESSGGPFGPKTERENYKLLGAIIDIEGEFRYYVKLTGPKATIDANAEGFAKMVKGMAAKGQAPAGDKKAETKSDDKAEKKEQKAQPKSEDKKDG